MIVIASGMFELIFKINVYWVEFYGYSTILLARIGFENILFSVFIELGNDRLLSQIKFKFIFYI